jgi:hypothetical protein
VVRKICRLALPDRKPRVDNQPAVAERSGEKERVPVAV